MIFGSKAEQIQLYHHVGVPALQNTLTGFNGTIFAYPADTARPFRSHALCVPRGYGTGRSAATRESRIDCGVLQYSRKNVFAFT